MSNFLWGAISFCALLVLQKAVAEPIAKNFGQRLLRRHLGPISKVLDAHLDHFGLDFDPETLVTEYLDLNEDKLSEAEKRKLIDQIFTEWDLRIAAKTCTSTG